MALSREGLPVLKTSVEEGDRLLRIVRRGGALQADERQGPSGPVVTWRRARVVRLSTQGWT